MTSVSLHSGPTRSILIHWTACLKEDQKSFWPSWRIESDPALDLVLRGESHDAVNEAFKLTRLAVSQLNDALDSAEDDPLVSIEALQQCDIAADFAWSKALAVATRHIASLQVSGVQDTEPNSFDFAPLQIAGISIVPEVTQSYVGYRLRSMSGANWWRTPLPELEKRKAAQEVTAAQCLHPLLSSQLGRWGDLDSALVTLYGADSAEQEAYFQRELEKIASKAIEQFKAKYGRSSGNGISGVQMQYERYHPSSESSGLVRGRPEAVAAADLSRARSTVAAIALSPPGRSPRNPLSQATSIRRPRARACTAPTVDWPNIPSGDPISSESPSPKGRRWRGDERLDWVI